ncbi:hypothetical protein B0A48_01297 [Cryoendolithus antarcticus]|uniref:Uncharacterized protein n=1 Tax=Cryoendolithus antarcticus TaxID=1507870 RepID=A0A1V8TST2_9PEZI|nr:hypothetical protein B0A48_01297 [Cryoendolithus antarcticus]
MAALNNEQQAKLKARNNRPFNNSGTIPLNVPGAGCPIEAELDIAERFRHGVNDFRQDRLTVREVTMLALMDAITDKDSWTDKVFDDSIVEKWRVEAMAMPFISDRAWEWCVLELRGKAKLTKERGFTTTLETGSACAKADSLVDEHWRIELTRKANSLLHVHPEHKDWHPGSNEQVLNLVHPSLFPLVYGRTAVLQQGQVGLRNCVDYVGRGTPVEESISKPPADGRRAQDGATFSSKFQWLPAEVRFCNGSDTEVEITSYINNLHPVGHSSLYRTIGKIISKAIPMWNETLVKDYNNRYPLRIAVEGAVFEPLSYPSELDDLADTDVSDPTAFAAALWRARAYMDLPEQPSSINSALHFAPDGDDEMPDFESDFTGEIDQALRWKHNRLRKIVHPEPGADYTYEQWKEGKAPKPDPPKVHYLGGEQEGFNHEYQKVCLEDEFREQGLQVIVKLASIELTPEKPVFEGGNWHLEGMMNEPTAIYYYDVENVTSPRLEFRMEAELDSVELSYEQDDHAPLATIFGLPSLRDEPAVQNVGAVLCRPGRLLAFPNTLQHRVQSFGLEDPSRPGHRRFLVLWLVDPHYRILSTANVPPQQHEWFAPRNVDKVLESKNLAVELQDMIKEHTDDYPMSLETAKRLRLELMEERTKLMPTVERNFEEYNFCEH